MQVDAPRRGGRDWLGWLMIRPGEGRLMLYLAGVFLLFGLGMALGRASSDTLFFKRFGVEYLPQMFFATSLLLMAFSLAYAEYADRWKPGRMLQVMGGVLAGLLLLNWLAMQGMAGAYAYAAYYLVYAVASEIILVHLGLYANSFLDSQQGKRLLPSINAAARVGAVLGGLSLGLLAEHWPTQHIALLWIGSLLLLLAAVNRHHARHPEAGRPAALRRRPSRRFSGVREGLYFARRSRLLTITGWGMFLLIILVCLQDYLTSTLLTRHYQDERDLAAFFGWFFAASNALVLAMQLLLTNRLLRRFGLRTVNLIFPASTLATFAALAVAPGFYAAVLGRFNYTGMLPAFRIPAANLFYNALPAYMQGRARALMVGLVLPAGLAVSGLFLMLVPQTMVGRGLALVGVVLAALFLAIKLGKNAAYGDSLTELIRQQVFSDQIDPIQDGVRLDKQAAGRLAAEIPHADDATAVAYADILCKYAPEQAAGLLLTAAAQSNIRLQDRLLPRLAQLGATGWQDLARRLLEQPDRHAQATALTLLGRAGDPAARQLAATWLAEANPRQRAIAAAVLARQDDPETRRAGLEALHQMLASARRDECIAAAQAVERTGDIDLAERLEPILTAADARLRAAGLSAYATLCGRRGADCGAALERGQGDASAQVRAVAARHAGAVPDPGRRLNLLAPLLADPAPEVRQAAGNAARTTLGGSAETLETGMTRHFTDFRLFPFLVHACQALPVANREPLVLRLALRHAGAALDKRRLAERIEARQDPADALPWVLRQTLREEAGRHVEMALTLLAEAGRGEAVRRLIPALRSGDRRLRAQALESLQCQLHGELAELLSLLLDEAPIPARQSEAEVWQRVEPVASHWLRECMTTYRETADGRARFAV